MVEEEQAPPFSTPDCPEAKRLKRPRGSCVLQAQSSSAVKWGQNGDPFPKWFSVGFTASCGAPPAKCTGACGCCCSCRLMAESGVATSGSLGWGREAAGEASGGVCWAIVLTFRARGGVHRGQQSLGSGELQASAGGRGTQGIATHVTQPGFPLFVLT